jgi:hypothetical protein
MVSKRLTGAYSLRDRSPGFAAIVPQGPEGGRAPIDLSLPIDPGLKTRSVRRTDGKRVFAFGILAKPDIADIFAPSADSEGDIRKPGCKLPE